MRMTSFAAALVICLLTGCSNIGLNSGSSQLVTAQVPLTSGYLLTTQPKMQALAHWDRLAIKVAENCSKALGHFYPNDDVRVYVAPLGATPFGKSFREALITRLVDYGVPISFDPAGAAVLEATVDLVTHSRTLAQTPAGRRQAVDPGFVQHKDGEGKYLPVPMVYEESGTLAAQASDTEVQINSGLIYQNVYLCRDTSIFYIDGKDWAHYQIKAPRGQVELKHFTLVRQ